MQSTTIFTPTQLVQSFNNWSRELLSSRTEADKYLLNHFEKSIHAHESIAEILWQSGFTLQTPYKTMIDQLSEDFQADKRAAGQQLQEMFQYYCRDLLEKAHHFFKNFPV